jgi:hypothetical protein
MPFIHTIILTISAVIGLAVTCFVTTPARAEMGWETIEAFCEDSEGRNFGKEGRQPNGRIADEMVMALAPGRYTDEEGTVVELTEKGAFILTPSKRLNVFGTEGDDILMGKRVAGCSKEQLSEALRRNQIAAPTGKPEKIDDLKK